MLAAVFVFGVGGWVATATGFLGRFWRAFDLTAHFRPQLAAVLAGTSAIFFIARGRRVGSAFALGAVVNAVLIAPYMIPRNSAAVEPTLRVGLMNLSVTNTRADLVLEEVKRQEPDVMVLLEYTTRWAHDLEPVRKDLPHAVEVARESPFGIALLSRLPLVEGREIRLIGNGGPVILVRVAVEGRELEILAMHPFPPIRRNGTALRDRELEAAARFIGSRDGPIVIVGDLNASYWSYAFRSLVAQTALRPAARREGLHLTWPTDLSMLRIPIDHILLSDHLAVADFRRGAYVGSDHFPVWSWIGWARWWQPDLETTN